MSKLEQTLSIIKPDAVERNLDNEIKELFIKNGFKITIKINWLLSTWYVLFKKKIKRISKNRYDRITKDIPKLLPIRKNGSKTKYIKFP